MMILRMRMTRWRIRTPSHAFRLEPGLLLAGHYIRTEDLFTTVDEGYEKGKQHNSMTSRWIRIILRKASGWHG